MHEHVTAWFWSRVDKSGECWEWQRACDSKGYGQMRLLGQSKRKRFRAHRISWELAYGAIPSGLLVLHRCDNRRCVRPEHLFIGTSGDNSRDAMAKGRLRGIAIGVGLRDNRGSRHGMSKLTEAEVRDIRARLARGTRPSVLAREYRVSLATLSRIRHGYGWRHVHDAPAVAGTGP